MNRLKMMVLLFVLLMYKVQAQTENKLTAQEKANGWQLVFDGKSFAGLQKLADGGWVVKDGLLMATPIAHGKQMDIITTASFDNFELTFEFRSAKNTNSGVKYLVTNTFPGKKGTYLGLEYQILDDLHYQYPERGELRSVASLYDLIPADPKKEVKALGEWNTAKIIVNGRHISHWLNGKKVVAYDRSTPAFAQLIQASKYKDLQNFGKAEKGHLLFQNEGTPVDFRNIKIRPLTNVK
ncbi:3-keto-disaccharide hydrolase [Olivibacter jilunii]|uniref:3-keto-disaccharide hydrolase n=1 Tax=Olivibacter jilunii TaxID=985016 RepID=UPI003F168145